MDLYSNSLYMEDIDFVAGMDLTWEKLRGGNILLSGATGLIGSFLIDVIMEKNIREDMNCTIYAMGRDKEKARIRFGKFENDPHLIFFPCDVKLPLVYNDIGKVDYVVHLASNTHPMQYATDPIGTITTNVIGTQNMLDFAVEHQATRFVFASSNEIYGENRGDVELFKEDYCGYIDSNTLRAGYPESKRCGEALCQAYKSQKQLDVVIPRLTRSYGPTMLMSDTKAISQFIKKGINKEDIVLKSVGTQYYSFTYAADVVSGLLFVMLKGESGKAYNIADEKSDVMLRDLASIIAKIAETKVIYEIPDPTEASGYSKATKARLDGGELRKIGWSAKYNIEDGVERTIRILKSIRGTENGH